MATWLSADSVKSCTLFVVMNGPLPESIAGVFPQPCQLSNISFNPSWYKSFNLSVQAFFRALVPSKRLLADQ
jgi:hypothetical protein